MFIHPVFGPDRPRAARLAYFELQSAIRALDTCGGFPPESAVQRFREALKTRRMYAEYGDSVLEGGSS